MHPNPNLASHYSLPKDLDIIEARNHLEASGHVRIDRLLSSKLDLLEKTREYADVEWEREITSINNSDLSLTGGSTKHFAFGLIGKQETPLYRLATCSEIIDCIRLISGWNSISLLHAYLFYKAPRGGVTPWHQDASYLPIRGKAITIWIPLMELPEPNGMVFANGSQKLSINWEAIGKAGIHSYFTERGCSFELVSSLSPGDVDIHDSYVVHCGTDNFMANTRRVVAIAYLSGNDIYDPDYFDQRLDPNSGELVMRSELSQAYFRGLRPGAKVSAALPTLYCQE